MRLFGYCRLSRDEDKEDYASIEAQKSIIEEYTQRNKHEIVEYLEDDNISGYKFNRPALNEILDRLERNEADGIIAKDLSRIGRHNAKTLLLIEDVKQMNKTVIAIDDDYISSEDNDEILGIKTWVNERYIKDISKKIRSNTYSRMRNNTYINAIPFGYVKDPVTKSIIVNEEVRPIINRIFDLYKNGYGIMKIVYLFNKEDVPSPMQYFKTTAMNNGKVVKGMNKKNMWSYGTIRSILTNDFYTGTRRQHTTKREGIHGKQIKTSPEEQYIFENNHEAIISKYDFQQVQEIMRQRKEVCYRGNKKYYNPYTGKLFCNDCGKNLVAFNKKDRAKAYICKFYKKFGKEVCSTHYVKEADITLAIKENLKRLKSILSDEVIKLNKTVMDKIQSTNNYKALISKTKDNIERLKSEYKILVTQKIKAMQKNPEAEDIINEQYEALEKEKLNQINMLERQIIEFCEMRDKAEKFQNDVCNAEKLIDKIIESDVIQKNDIDIIIDRIIVYQDGHIELKLNDAVDYLLHNHLSMYEEQVTDIQYVIIAINYLAKAYSTISIR